MSKNSAWTYMPIFEGDRIMEKLLSADSDPIEYAMDHPANAEPGATVLHLSCNTLSIPHIAYLAQRVLSEMGLPFVSIGGPETCCGAPQWALGDEPKGRTVATMTLGTFRRSKPVRVVSTCPDCDILFELYMRKNEKFQQMNLLELLSSNLGTLKPLLKNPVRRKIVVHSHDENENRQTDTEGMHTLLSAVPGLEIVPSEHSAGLGNHCLVQSGRLDNTIFEPLTTSMFGEASALGADALVVPYHGCYRQHVKRQLEYDVDVFHYLSIVADSMGIQYEETFKNIRMMDDFDESTAALSGRARSFGISDDELRATLRGKVYV